MITDKQMLRIKAKELRKRLDMQAKSRLLCNKLRASEIYNEAKNIMIYYPLDHEINLLPLTDNVSKSFYLPRVNNDMLECCEYHAGDELKLSSYKVLEPVCSPSQKNIIDLAIIPALMCDKNNFRLGYGGGYYDRFLTNFCGITIACVPSELIIDQLPINDYDIRMDYVIVA